MSDGWFHREAHYKAWLASRRAAPGADIVCLGNSAMAHAVDPTLLGGLLGRSCFNAGVASLSMRGVVRWASEIVFPLLRPSTAVLGTTSYMFNDAGVSQRTSYTKLDESTSYGLAAALIASAGGWSDDLERSVETACPRLDDVFDAAGGRMYRESHERYTSVSNEAVAGSFDPFAVGGLETEAFSSLVGAARHAGVGLVVLDLPHTDDFRNKHPRGGDDVEAYRRVLRSAARRYGVRIVDAQSWFTSDQGFRDFAHLGPAGRAHLTKLLARELAQGD